MPSHFGAWHRTRDSHEGDRPVTKSIALFLLAVSLFTVAGSQILFKARIMQINEVFAANDSIFTGVFRALSDPPIWAAGLMTVVGAACWYLAMIKLPISFMLPISSLIGPIAAIGAYFLLGESLPPTKVGAIAVITIGATWLGCLSS